MNGLSFASKIQSFFSIVDIIIICLKRRFKLKFHFFHSNDSENYFLSSFIKYINILFYKRYANGFEISLKKIFKAFIRLRH
jgi:hypothetical protein